jgi:hypothetical protein
MAWVQSSSSSCPGLARRGLGSGVLETNVHLYPESWNTQNLGKQHITMLYHCGSNPPCVAEGWALQGVNFTPAAPSHTAPLANERQQVQQHDAHTYKTC